jgi:hypothetical protein
MTATLTRSFVGSGSQSQTPSTPDSLRRLADKVEEKLAMMAKETQLDLDRIRREFIHSRDLLDKHLPGMVSDNELLTQFQQRLAKR